MYPVYPSYMHPYNRYLPQPPYTEPTFSRSDGKSGEASIGGIVNVKYEFEDNGSIHVSANIANLFDVGSFTLDTENPMLNFTQGNSAVGYSITFGVDYDQKEFYMSGYVKIPFVSPLTVDRFVIFSWS